MTTADLQAAERAYQRARRDDRQGASVKRKAAVRTALDTGWTHRAVAEAMGKSTGWVGQLLAPGTPKMIASTTTVPQDRPSALDRFRKGLGNAADSAT